jgi:HAD superfamily hydrolase (TIGR01450 family)
VDINERLDQIKTYLSDMDGTLWLGNHLIDGADDFLALLREQGKQCIFLTNNSSKNRSFYQRKLLELGIEVTMESIVTSIEVLIYYLNRVKPGASLFPLGTGYFLQELAKAGFSLEFHYGRPVDFVVLGFDQTLTYEKLSTACRYIRKGVPYLASHPDLTCPIEGGEFIPDCGAITELIKSATGREPQAVTGKPNPLMVEMLEQEKTLEKNEMAVIGDRLYTDIALGVNSGIASILVLSGETTPDKARRSTVKPDYIFPSIKELACRLRKPQSLSGDCHGQK